MEAGTSKRKRKPTERYLNSWYGARMLAASRDSQSLMNDIIPQPDAETSGEQVVAADVGSCESMSGGVFSENSRGADGEHRGVSVSEVLADNLGISQPDAETSGEQVVAADVGSCKSVSGGGPSEHSRGADVEHIEACRSAKF